MTLETSYFERMAISLGDKLRIVEALPPVTPDFAPRVLDVGAGGGDFAQALSDLGYQVVALDTASDSLARMALNFPKLSTVQIYAHQAQSLGEGTFDAVVCSSVLHEVYSYGSPDHPKGSLASLEDALTSFRKLLKPGGVLVIRDGVKPATWWEPASLEVLDAPPEESITPYLEQCPFSNGEVGDFIKLQEQEGIFYGNLQSVFEAYMTYNWGVANYPREAQELYGVLTLQEYQDLLLRLGFREVTGESYLQEGYLEHLPKGVKLRTLQGTNLWPESNALWTARR